MKAPEQNVMDFFKNTGTKTNTKARGMNRRMEMELYYIDNLSFKMDVKVFFKTILSVLKKEGAI